MMMFRSASTMVTAFPTSHSTMTTPHTPLSIRIEILYFDGCPNHEKLLAHLPRLLQRERITADIVLRNVPDAEQALNDHFLGSPTILVNGRDVEPGASRRDDYGLKCRIYHTAGGLSGCPPDQWILAAIAAQGAGAAGRMGVSLSG
jgi:hypothetical protein